MDGKKHLRIFMNPEAALPTPPRPTPPQVLYSRANPDRTPKSCQNCVLWFASDHQCMIHSPDVVVAPYMVCGYHVFGRPHAGPLVPPTDLQPVEPYESGLVQVEGGTSCSSCQWYKPRGRDQGTCSVVRDPELDDADAVVEALGCCTHWESINGEGL